jgi:hypothetical protein
MGSLAIRKLRLATLAPRDHPAPDALAARLADAAQRLLPAALQQCLGGQPDRIIRIRRLALDITLGPGIGDAAFAGALAAAIARALGTGFAEPNEDIVSFATPAGYLAALAEALAAGRAAETWWLRDAEGLRFLPKPAAIRTALLADPPLGQAALLSLPPHRRAAVLAALSAREAERLLESFSASAPPASADSAACAAAIAAAAAVNPTTRMPLAFYLLVVAANESLAGPALAEAARQHAALETKPFMSSIAAFTPPQAGHADLAGPPSGGTQPGPAPASAPSTASFNRFAGLLLLAPGLDFEALAEAGDEARLVAFAALGLNAGRGNFAAWLRDPLWPAWFGLDPRATGAERADQLAAIPLTVWQALAPHGLPPETQHEARFLLPPRNLLGRSAALGLAGLAKTLSARFARRLTGLRAATAPFLWDNLLGAGGMVDSRPGGWEARLTRPPLDILLTLSRLADGKSLLPAATLHLSRAAS